MRHIFILAAAASAGSCERLSDRGMSCHEVEIPVTASAQNKVLPKSLNTSNLTKSFLNTVVASLPTTLTSGHYTIAGRYCEPAKPIPKRKHTLQVLVHGITYTRNYWSGLAPPGTKFNQEKYSWIDYASNEGYPTLSIDRLCNGNSSRPNGIDACQVPLQAETMHGVIEKARGGKIKEVDRKFSKIIYVGHSYGSLVANALSIQHPEDVDTYIMTGWSTKLAQGSPGVVVRPLYMPAKEAQPKRWPDLNDPSYTVATDLEGAKAVFYYGKYRNQEALYDWHHRGTVTRGEFATALIGQETAQDYTGPIFILNGDGDNIFCATTMSATIGNHGACTKGRFDQYSKSAYPNARMFGFHNTPDTGHCLNNHETAQQSFKAAHDFMQQAGF